MKTFILGDDGRTPVEVDQVAFTVWMRSMHGDRYPCVADAEVQPGVRILTQFIGTDPNGGDRCPFVTLVCGGEYDGYELRSSTWEKANRTHCRTFERVKRWVCEGKRPADFAFDITQELLLRWGFCQTDEGSEYERSLRAADEEPGFDGLNLVVRPGDGAVCLEEYDTRGRTITTIALPNQKTLGGVMRIVQALRSKDG